MISRNCEKSYHGACRDVSGCNCSCHGRDREKMKDDNRG